MLHGELDVPQAERDHDLPGSRALRVHVHEERAELRLHGPADLADAFAAAGISLVVCVLWRDAAVVGLVVNAVILAGLAAWTLVRRVAH